MIIQRERVTLPWGFVASEPAEARRLQVQRSAETGVAMDVQWNSSDICRGWQWHSIWSDGPTVDGMTSLGKRLLPANSAQDRDTLVYRRTIQPASVALSIVYNIGHSPAPLNEHRAGVELEHHREGVPYPERAADGDAELAAELCRLVPTGDAGEMAAAVGRYGLAGLRAGVSPPDNVLPVGR